MNEIEEIKESNLDNKDRSYATGKRKNSIARVWLKKGEGKISINGKIVTDFSYQVKDDDVILFNGKYVASNILYSLYLFPFMVVVILLILSML